MPIPITCPSCGAKANAPDTAAGKKVKCPKCQGIVGVPKPQVEELDEMEEEPVAPPPKASSKGGKLVPKKPAPPEDEEEDFEDEPPRKKKALPPPEDEDEEFDEDEPPRKKGKGGKPPANAPSKIVIALVAFFLGGWGVHKFMLGYTKAGVIMLLLTLSCFGAFITGPIALIEAIIYLTKSDEDFYETYVVGKKEWF